MNLDNYVEVHSSVLLTEAYTRDKFMQVEIGWEKCVKERYGYDLKPRRKLIYDTIEAVSKGKSNRVSWYCHRWVQGLFDSVNEFFSVGEMYFPVEWKLEGSTGLWFGHTLLPQAEFFPASPKDANVRDVDIFEAEKVAFGPNSCVAVRPKLSGCRFVVVDGWLCGLGVRVRLPPITVAASVLEWCDGVFHIVYPYAVPTHAVGPFNFVAHPFLHPSEIAKGTEEGWMLLYVEASDTGFPRYVEKRIKHKPTIEISIPNRADAWEVAWDNITGRVVPVRPRVGKNPRQMAEVRLYGCSGQLTKIYPEYRVQEKHSGPFIGYFCRRGDACVVIDSGWRLSQTGIAPVGVDPIPVTVPVPTQCGDALWYDVNGKRFCLPQTSPIRNPGWLKNNFVTGAKVFMFNPRTEDYLLVKEGSFWSLPGGKLEYGEDSRTALLRELKEEIGIQFSPRDDIRFIGIHSSEQDGTFYHTFMYMMAMFYDCSVMSPYAVAYSKDVPDANKVFYIPAHYAKMRLYTGSAPLSVLGYGLHRDVTIDTDLTKINVRFKMNLMELDTQIPLDSKNVGHVANFVPITVVSRVILHLVMWRAQHEGRVSATAHELWSGSAIELHDFCTVISNINDVCELDAAIALVASRPIQIVPGAKLFQRGVID